MNPWLYFWLFLKASLLSTGGLGNLPFLHQDLMALGAVKETDFLTAIAVGQVSPGPTGLWSLSLGYLTYGWMGAGLAGAALSLPPLLVMAVAALYRRYENLSAVRDFMTGLSLGVVGLTLAVSAGLAKPAIGDWRDALVAAAALALAMNKKVPVVVILLLAALAGVVVYH